MKISELLEKIKFSKNKISILEEALLDDYSNNALVEALLSEWEMLEQYNIVLKRSNQKVVAEGKFSADINANLSVLLDIRETISKKIKLIEKLMSVDDEKLNKISLIGQRENYVKEYLEIDSIIKEVEITNDVV
jgi:hypothetical protein